MGLAVGLALCASLACSTETTSNDDDDGGSTTSGAGGATTTSGSGATSTTSGSGAATSTTSGSGGSSAQCDGGPLPNPIPNCAPAPPPSTGDFGQDCVDRINQFRWECQCLPPMQRWNAAETCTDQQSADDQQSGQAHGNFPACGENAQNTCPNWPSEAQVIGGCLQMMWDEGPGEPFAEHGHYLNMSSTSFGQVACGRSTNGSGVWSNQNFKP
jgi:hypothetical protein